MIETAPLPDLDADSTPFWAACGRGELTVQACGACGRRRFPPRPMCPACRSLDSRWQPVAGSGSIWSYVVAHPPLLPAFAAHAPYPVVVVALDEDPAIRLVGNLLAQPGAAIGSVPPAELRIGARVRVSFEPVAGGVVLPQWVFA